MTNETEPEWEKLPLLMLRRKYPNILPGILEAIIKSYADMEVPGEEIRKRLILENNKNKYSGGLDD